jgi:hypothetical protein
VLRENTEVYILLRHLVGDTYSNVTCRYGKSLTSSDNVGLRSLPYMNPCDYFSPLFITFLSLRTVVHLTARNEPVSSLRQLRNQKSTVPSPAESFDVGNVAIIGAGASGIAAAK